MLAIYSNDIAKMHDSKSLVYSVSSSTPRTSIVFAVAIHVYIQLRHDPNQIRIVLCTHEVHSSAVYNLDVGMHCLKYAIGGNRADGLYSVYGARGFPNIDHRRNNDTDSAYAHSRRTAGAMYA